MIGEVRSTKSRDQATEQCGHAHFLSDEGIKIGLSCGVLFLVTRYFRIPYIA
jgi:hypothetical protein